MGTRYGKNGKTKGDEFSMHFLRNVTVLYESFTFAKVINLYGTLFY